MAKKIKVDTAELQSAAALMKSQIEDYRTLYNNLFSEVDGMAAHWQGADNIAFTEQIKGFMDDFQKMEQEMNNYAEFLEKCSIVYSETQENVIASAKTLTN